MANSTSLHVDSRNTRLARRQGARNCLDEYSIDQLLGLMQHFLPPNVKATIADEINEKLKKNGVDIDTLMGHSRPRAPDFGQDYDDTSDSEDNGAGAGHSVSRRRKAVRTPTRRKRMREESDHEEQDESPSPSKVWPESLFRKSSGQPYKVYVDMETKGLLGGRGPLLKMIKEVRLFLIYGGYGPSLK